MYKNTLQLTVTYLQKHILLILVDNRSAVNVCSWRIVGRLGIKESQLLTL